MIRIFHVSENPGIEVFHPRPPPNPEAGVTGHCVWAVDEEHLCNYLLPRDCPRVTFAGPSGRVVAVENAWLERIKACRLFVYELPAASFQCIDKGAGYFISRSSVTPIGSFEVRDLISKISDLNVEFRTLERLWELRDEVSSSGLEFSIIRFRNAQPRIP